MECNFAELGVFGPIIMDRRGNKYMVIPLEHYWELERIRTRNEKYQIYINESNMKIKINRKLNELTDEEIKVIAVILIDDQSYRSDSIIRKNDYIKFNFTKNSFDKLPHILTIYFDELDFLDLDKPLTYPNEFKYDNSYRIPQMKVIEVYNYLQSIDIEL